MVKSVAARRMTGTEELLEAMSKDETAPQKVARRNPRWSQILFASLWILIIAAAAGGFHYLRTEVAAANSSIGTAANDLTALKAQVSAADTREQLAAVNAEIDDLRTENAQLRSELQEMKEALESLKTRKATVVAAPRKRR